MPYGGLPNFGNPMSVMPYGGLPNFGNTTSGALMPFMAQSSMPSSLPEPQPARAADAAATTPAAASSTNPHPTDTHPQSHSRRSRSRHRRHRHSHSHTSHHRGHDKSPQRHTTRRARSSTRSHSPSRPHHRSRRSHRNPISLRSRSPQRRSPQRHSPAPRTTAPHRAPQTLPRFHFPAHFRMGHRQVSQVLSTLVEPIVGTPTAEPQYKPLGQAPPQHQQHRQLEQSGQATVLATAATWATTAPPIPCWPQQRQHAPYPCTRGGFANPLPALHLPNPPPNTPWMTLKTWIPLRRRQSSTQTPTTGGLIYGEASWTLPRLTQCEFPRPGSWGAGPAMEQTKAILTNLDPPCHLSQNAGNCETWTWMSP